jgi:hypothetical protein
VVHSGEVEHAPEQAHSTHVRQGHAFWPGVSDKEAVKQEVALG